MDNLIIISYKKWIKHGDAGLHINEIIISLIGGGVNTIITYKINSHPTINYKIISDAKKTMSNGHDVAWLHMHEVQVHCM